VRVAKYKCNVQAVSTKSNGYFLVQYDVGDDVIAHITSKPMRMDIKPSF